MINTNGLVVCINHNNEKINEIKKFIKKNHKNLLDNKNIILVNDDGEKGFIKYALYDAIYVGFPVDAIPKNLIAQLANGGGMLIPLKKKNNNYIMMLVDKNENGIINYLKLNDFIQDDFYCNNLKIILSELLIKLIYLL